MKLKSTVKTIDLAEIYHPSIFHLRILNISITEGRLDPA